MKKKSVLMLLAIGGVFCGVGKSFAQSGDVTLNVKLKPILNIAVSNGQTVDLEFATATDYQNGVTSDIADHLTVSSTSGFTVSVKSSGDLVNGTSPSLPIGDVAITSQDGSAHPIAGVDGTSLVSGLALTNAAQPIFTSTSGTALGTINVNYKAKLTDDDLDTQGIIINTTTGEQTYTATLTYTIATP